MKLSLPGFSVEPRLLPRLDLSNWPTVEEDQIKSRAARTKFQKRCDAVHLFQAGHRTEAAAKTANISGRNLRRLLNRCLKIAPDGRPWGYRALVPRVRVHQAVRTAPLKIIDGQPQAGFTGAFAKLLADHPSIQEGLEKCLGRLGPDSYQPNTMRGRQLHKKFLDLCLEAGLTDADYPLNTVEKCRRTLTEWIKRVYLPRHASIFVKAEHGEDAATAYDYQVDGDTRRTPARPWDEWQIDQVKIDVRARYELLSADGVSIHLELPRIVAVVCKDTGSGAVPAWKLVLGPEANVGDVLEVLWLALSGPLMVEQTVPESGYNAGAGFPASVIPELRYALPRKLSLDNALVHLADDLRNALEKVCGCKVLLGRPKTPLEHSSIEAEHSVMARKLLHQLPATTGTGPKDPKRKASERPLEGLIRVDELHATVDVYYANRNGLPHAASNYVAPLERLGYAVKHGQLHPIMLSPNKRHAHFFGFRKEVTVHADLSKGRRPFVNFMGRRYSGAALKSFAGYVGKKLIVRASPLDLRTIVAFDQNGLELGTLRAEGKWGVLPHDLRISRLFRRLRRENSLGKQAEDDPLRALFAYLNRGAKRDATLAAQLAHLLQYLRGYVDELSAGLLTDIDDHHLLMKAANDTSVIAIDPLPSVATPGASVPASAAIEATRTIETSERSLRELEPISAAKRAYILPRRIRR